MKAIDRDAVLLLLLVMLVEQWCLGGTDDHDADGQCKIHHNRRDSRLDITAQPYSGEPRHSMEGRSSGGRQGPSRLTLTRHGDWRIRNT